MLRMAIIGFGRHAIKRLIPAFRLTKSAQLVAIQKRDPAALAQAMDAFGVPGGFTDLNELPNRNDFDAVFIASPPGLHKMQAIASALAGKHILMEKPMAANAGEAREMIEIAEKHGVTFCPAFCMRFTDVISKVVGIIEAGEIGEVRSVDARFCYDAADSDRQWLNNPQMSGGGPMADLGSHLLDLITYVLRDPIAKISSIVKNGNSPADVEKGVTLALQTDSGILGTLYTSFELPRSKQLTFYGTKANLSLQDFTATHRKIDIHIDKQGQRDVVSVRNENHFAAMIDAFAGAVLLNNESPVAPEAGLRNQLLIDQVYRRPDTAQH